MKALPILFASAIASKNGGSGCYTCMIISTWVEQYSRANNIRYDVGMSQFCQKLGRLEPICQEFSADLGAYFQEAFELGNTVDSLCYCMGECYISEGHRYCSFYPEKENEGCPENTDQIKRSLTEMKSRLDDFCMEGPENFAICKGFASFGFEDWLEEIVDRLDRHVPAIDDDGDLFGLRTGGARGFWWRAKDCIDQDDTIYPGQPPVRGDRFIDANCNGISGMENDVSIEDTYCADSGAIGVAVLGDSAGAHFSIPEVWFTPHLWTEESMPFKDAEIALANELDWPHLSWITGFKGNCWETGPKSWVDGKYVDSIYSRLVERNRCNLNDFINQANNGCKSSSMADKTIFGLGRKPLDKPMLVFLSLVGNDVCNTKINTEEYMTTPERFYEKTLESLNYLETILPEGSAVVVTGLAQGELLFEILADRLHPLGELDQDATYEDFYNYMECLEVSPCTGWMSSDQSRRDFTTERAQNLTATAEILVEDQRNNFNNFELIYMDYPLDVAFEIHEKNGGELWQGIETTDGFHPSHTAHVLLAELFWDRLMRDYPHILGPVNPHNEKLAALQNEQLLTCNGDE